MSRTPYAVLLVRPGDPDEVIRRAYHEIARREHPDAVAAKPSDSWFAATEAYSAIKTAEKRAAWEAGARLLSGGCAACKGCGVKGTRMFKGVIRVCEGCGGEGRLR